MGVQLFQRIRSMLPELLNVKGKLKVIEAMVGKRPTKLGGLRLEIAWMKQDSYLKIRHAYVLEKV